MASPAWGKSISELEQSIQQQIRQQAPAYQLAESYQALGLAYYEHKRYGPAIQSLKRGLQLATLDREKRSMSDRISANIRYYLGKLYHESGKFDYALASLHMVTDVPALSPQAQRDVWILLGDVYEELGQLSLATTYWKRAYDEMQQPPLAAPGTLMKAAYHLGEIHGRQEMYPKAMDYFDHALRLANTLGSGRWSCSILVAMGHVCRDQQEQERALGYLTQALVIAKKQQAPASEKLQLGQVFLELGHTYANMGRFEDAEYEFLQALAIAEKLGDPVLRMNCLHGMGENHLQAGSLVPALHHLEEALVIAQDLHIKDIQQMLTQHMARIQLERGQSALAFDLLDRSMKLQQEMFHERMEKIIQNTLNEHTAANYQEHLQWVAEAHQHELRVRSMYIQGAILGLLALSLILWLIYNQYRIQKHANTQLEDKREEIETINAKLKTSNQSLEQFASIASHDLQEPLRMVASFTALLRQRYKDQFDEDAREFMFYITDGVERMRKLLEDLLDYSRLSSRNQQKDVLDVNEVVDEVLHTLQFRIEEHRALVHVDQLPSVWGNSVQIGQLFQNLVTNALKFRAEAAPVIQIRCERINHHYHFSVSDNGIGIPEADQDRIFQIFQRLHQREDYEGTGIGLAVCQRILENHQGRIWVQSEVGQGTTFHFTLPIKRPHGARASVQPPSASEGTGKPANSMEIA